MNHSLNTLRSEIANANLNLNALRSAVVAQPLVGPSLEMLFSKGVTEQDIIHVANSFKMLRSNSKSGSSNDNVESPAINIDEQCLISELQKHSKTRFTIHELYQSIDKLINQIKGLQRQKNDLGEQSQNILCILAYSKLIVRFLDRLDDVLSNDVNNVKMLSIIALILVMLYIRYEGAGKLLTDDLKELAPIARFIGTEGKEGLSLSQLKMAYQKPFKS